MINARDLSTHRNGVFEQHLINVGPRRPMVLSPDPGNTPVRIELDLALQIPDDIVAVLSVNPHLLELGLVPAIGTDFITCERPIRPLALWVFPPKEPVALDSGTTLATVIFLSLAAVRDIYSDPGLDIGEEFDEGDRSLPFLFFGGDGEDGLL